MTSGPGPQSWAGPQRMDQHTGPARRSRSRAGSDVSPAWTTSGDRIRQAGPGQFAGFSFFLKSEFKIKKT